MSKLRVKVKVVSKLDRRDFSNPESRVPGAIGIIIKHHDSHGLCYEVRHEDGTVGCYDPDELVLIE